VANPEHLAKLKEGVGAFNQWRTNNPEVKPDFFGANLREAILVGANFYKANLHMSDLNNAYLSGANLRSSRHSATRFRIIFLGNYECCQTKQQASEGYKSCGEVHASSSCRRVQFFEKGSTFVWNVGKKIPSLIMRALESSPGRKQIRKLTQPASSSGLR